jgi:hypothetical protein
MGLDMYLFANHYVNKVNWKDSHDGNWCETEDFTALVNTLDCRESINKDDVTGITIDIPIGYWRKANAIHNWFVSEMADGRDECQDIYCAKENLKELRSICSDVLRIKTEEYSREHLPSKSGFFFGMTEYNEYYYNDLEETIKILDRALASRYDTFIYRASW